jgi:hypothetical protein
LSRLYLESGQNEQAAEQCRLALHDDPSDPTALYRLIRALQKSGKPPDHAKIPGLVARFTALRQKLSEEENHQSRHKIS